MEYRNDLASVLLSGLPDDERDHVVNVIDQLEAERLRRKRASGGPVDVAELDADDLDEASDTDEYLGRVSPQA